MTDENEILEQQRKAREASWPTGIPTSVSYLHGEVPLTEYLRWRGERNADKAAIHFYGTDVTFADLNDQSESIAHFLVSQGVQPGDRVALMMQNCPQYVIAFWGIIKASAVVVPMNPMFKEAEVEYELADSEAVGVIVQNELAPLVESVRAGSSVRFTVGVTLGEYADPATDIPLPFSTDGAPDDAPVDLPWSQALQAPAVELPASDLDALAALNYTGGTTGMPKGVEHTQRHMLYTAAAATTVRAVGQNAGDTIETATLSFLAVFWIAGENIGVIGPVYSGGTCVMLTRWDPLAVLKSVQRHGVASMAGTVDNYLELLDHPDFGDYDMSSLTFPATMSFVTKLDPQIRRRWADAVPGGPLLREGSYGMTETHTQDTFITGFQDDDYDLHAAPVFVGLPVPGTEIKVCDFETHVVCPTGVEGEILVKSPSVLNGYWRKPEANADSFIDGWFRTGDIGVIQEDGTLRYLGRKKEMLKVNGMSVFPSEIETLISAHPAVTAVAVIGVPDPKTGERPRAYVEVAPGAPSPDELRVWAKDHMATYKVPDFVIVDALPRTTTGKIRKTDIPR